jgi:pimeloyl-ACP methyl ester carboxylesterase
MNVRGVAGAGVNFAYLNKKMKTRLLLILSVLFLIGSLTIKSQDIDTLVDVGGYKLHFHIIKGKGMPILFESGGGDDGSTWNRLVPYIADTLGTTLITYDRPGFGKSELDTSHTGILNDIKRLETGLQKLGYGDKIMLVAHSLGGFYATVYAARHPKAVKAAVLVDANTSCFFTEAYVTAAELDAKSKLEKLKRENPGVYYIYTNLRKNAELMRHNLFPLHIPITDIVAERTPFEGTRDAKRWKMCHTQFVAASPKRKGITAYGSGHYIHREKPDLVLDAIVKEYFAVVVPAVRAEKITFK